MESRRAHIAKSQVDDEGISRRRAKPLESVNVIAWVIECTAPNKSIGQWKRRRGWRPEVVALRLPGENEEDGAVGDESEEANDGDNQTHDDESVGREVFHHHQLLPRPEGIAVVVSNSQWGIVAIDAARTVVDTAISTVAAEIHRVDNLSEREARQRDDAGSVVRPSSDERRRNRKKGRKKREKRESIFHRRFTKKKGGKKKRKEFFYICENFHLVFYFVDLFVNDQTDRKERFFKDTNAEIIEKRGHDPRSS